MMDWGIYTKFSPKNFEKKWIEEEVETYEETMNRQHLFSDYMQLKDTFDMSASPTQKQYKRSIWVEETEEDSDHDMLAVGADTAFFSKSPFEGDTTESRNLQQIYEACVKHEQNLTQLELKMKAKTESTEKE